MRNVFIFIIAFTCCSSLYAKDKDIIQRHQLGSWEKDIGYSGITQVGNTLYISGVACDGANMEVAVTNCYKELTGILAKYNVSTDHIVKENIYTVDMDALIKAIPNRKTFFTNARYPAATWVQVNRLYNPAHLLEIELIVVLDK
jgi:enamine deaminase RidA (YjgF/YER057c/UK114 family)